MTTTKSYSNSHRLSSVYKSSLKSQAPFMVITGILMLIIIPIVLYVTLREPPAIRNFASLERLAGYYREMFEAGIYTSPAQSGVAAFVLMVMAFASALFAQKHMHSKKMTDLYHSLPIDRPRLLVAGSAASMTAVLGPYTALYSLTFLAEQILYAKYGCFTSGYYQYVLADFICTVLYVMVVYAFTVFVAVHVGTVFDAFAITGVLGFVPMFLYLICGSLWSHYTYGSSFWPEYAAQLSPFTFMYPRYGYIAYESMQVGDTYYSYARYDFWAMTKLMAGWAVIGAILFAAAIFFYKRRKSELAEQTQPRGVFQVIVKCFAAFCGAMLFLAIFDSYSGVEQAVAMLVGAVIIGTVAELILSRGVRHLLRNLILLAGTGVLSCAMVYGVRVDAIGYVARVPDASQVQSVYISYSGSYGENHYYSGYYNSYYQRERGGMLGDLGRIKDPNTISFITDIHRAAVADYPENNGYSDYSDKYYSAYIDIEYRLNNGTTLSRTYHRMNLEALNKLVDLEAEPDFIRAKHPLFFRSPNLSADTPLLLRSVSVIPLLSDGSYSTVNLDGDKMTRLVEALRRDILEEPIADRKNPQEPAWGYLTFRFKDIEAVEREFAYIIKGQLDYYYSGQEVTIPLSAGYTNTIAALKELKLYDALTATGIAQVDRVYFQRIPDYDRARYDIIRTSLPQYYGDYEYLTDMIDLYHDESASVVRPDISDVVLAHTENPAEMQAVYRKCKTRMMMTPESYNEVVKAIFLSGEKIWGIQYVRIDDLPWPVKEKLNKNLDELRMTEESAGYMDEYYYGY